MKKKLTGVFLGLCILFVPVLWAANVTITEVATIDSLGRKRAVFSSSEKIELSIKCNNDVDVGNTISFEFIVYDPVNREVFHHTGNAIIGAPGEGGSFLRSLPMVFYTTPGRYTFRAKIGATGGSDSKDTYFTISSPYIKIIRPFNNSTVIEPAPTFEWVSSGAAKYMVLVDLDQSFQNPVWQGITTTSSIQYPLNSASVRARLLNNKKYWWKVEGLDADGNRIGVCSEPFCFTVASQSSRDVEVNDIFISQPIWILSPEGQLFKMIQGDWIEEKSREEILKIFQEFKSVITVRIKNLGTQNESDIPLKLFIEGREVGKEVIPFLSVGTSKEIPFEILSSQIVAADFKKVMVSAMIEVEDQNKQNNLLMKPLTIGIPPKFDIALENLKILDLKNNQEIKPDNQGRYPIFNERVKLIFTAKVILKTEGFLLPKIETRFPLVILPVSFQMNGEIKGEKSVKVKPGESVEEFFPWDVPGETKTYVLRISTLVCPGEEDRDNNLLETKLATYFPGYAYDLALSEIKILDDKENIIQPGSDGSYDIIGKPVKVALYAASSENVPHPFPKETGIVFSVNGVKKGKILFDRIPQKQLCVFDCPCGDSGVYKLKIYFFKVMGNENPRGNITEKEIRVTRPPAPTGQIAGRVIKRDFAGVVWAMGVPEALISYSGLKDGEIKTNNQGYYLIKDLPAGKYKMMANKPPYFGNSEIREVEIKEGEVAEGIELSLPGLSFYINNAILKLSGESVEWNAPITSAGTLVGVGKGQILYCWVVDGQKGETLSVQLSEGRAEIPSFKLFSDKPGKHEAKLVILSPNYLECKTPVYYEVKSLPTSILSVIAIPRSAEIYLDGVLKGRSSDDEKAVLIIKDVPAGQHLLEVKKDNFYPDSRTVTVPPDQELTIKLAPKAPLFTITNITLSLLDTSTVEAKLTGTGNGSASGYWVVDDKIADSVSIQVVNGE